MQIDSGRWKPCVCGTESLRRFHALLANREKEKRQGRKKQVTIYMIGRQYGDYKAPEKAAERLRKSVASPPFFCAEHTRSVHVTSHIRARFPATSFSAFPAKLCTAWLGSAQLPLRACPCAHFLNFRWCLPTSCGAAGGVASRGMARWAVTAAAAAAAVGGASVQNIALVWWTSGSSSPSAVNGTAAGGGGGAPAGTPRGTSPFAVLFIGCLYFLLTFCVLIGLRAGAAGGDWAMFLPSHDAVRGSAGHCRSSAAARCSLCSPARHSPAPASPARLPARRRKTCCARAAAARPNARAAAPSRPSGAGATATPTGSGR